MVLMKTIGTHYPRRDANMTVVAKYMSSHLPSFSVHLCIVASLSL